MRHSVLRSAALLLILAAAPSGQSPESGRITGRVRLTATVPGSPLPSSLYPSRSIGRRDASRLPEIRNVVVHLRDAAFSRRVPTTPAELRQRNETFTPHVLAVTTGSTVSFPNQDPFFHNVFSLSGAAKFDLGRYPEGQTRSREFDKSGIVKVYCHIHSHMTATILVLDHPYFSIPQTDGSFAINDVPPGAYTLVGWHERVGERVFKIRVEAGKATTIDITVPVEDAR